MTHPNLGRLERVDVRDVWTSEATDFKPWLARPENLSVLAEKLGIELELEAQERSVGPFRAGILCKEIGTDRSRFNVRTIGPLEASLGLASTSGGTARSYSRTR
jgi:hypothetical protein